MNIRPKNPFNRKQTPKPTGDAEKVGNQRLERSMSLDRSPSNPAFGMSAPLVH